MWTELIIFAIVAFIFFYRWATKNNDFFKKRNIPYDKPFFLMGSGIDILLGKKSVVEFFMDIYNKHDGIVYGTFDNRDPVLFIRDPQLVKQILIKDFDHFINRRPFMETGSENLMSNSIFFLQDEKWRDMRNTLSPAFTGSKMRQMFKLMEAEIPEAMKYLQDQIKNTNSEENGLEVDVKDFSSHLTVNIIASTAFGFQLNTFKDRNNEFFTKAQKAIKFTRWVQIKLVFMVLFPKLAKILKMNMFDKDFSNYFMHLVLDTIKYRLEHNIQRPDMINLLLEARGMIPSDVPKTHFRQWSDSEVVAQCFVFFIAGMESLATVMSFSAHELMEHSNVQEKLFEEIQQVAEDLENDEVTYETLQKMPYLDKVVSEILRKWPVALLTDRVCNKDFTYELNGERLDIKKGEMVRIPMMAIQNDPKYYPHPEVIDPERFNDANNIDSGIYLPFGIGPRNCIANRFAILEVKAFLFHLIKTYRLEASPKSTRPLELKKSAFQLMPKNGFWLQFVPRK